jgi:hypothetical protein
VAWVFVPAVRDPFLHLPPGFFVIFVKGFRLNFSDLDLHSSNNNYKTRSLPTGSPASLSSTDSRRSLRPHLLPRVWHTHAPESSLLSLARGCYVCSPCFRRRPPLVFLGFAGEFSCWEASPWRRVCPMRRRGRLPPCLPLYICCLFYCFCVIIVFGLICCFILPCSPLFWWLSPYDSIHLWYHLHWWPQLCGICVLNQMTRIFGSIAPVYLHS